MPNGGEREREIGCRRYFYCLNEMCLKHSFYLRKFVRKQMKHRMHLASTCIGRKCDNLPIVLYFNVSRQKHNAYEMYCESHSVVFLFIKYCSSKTNWIYERERCIIFSTHRHTFTHRDYVLNLFYFISFHLYAIIF